MGSSAQLQHLLLPHPVPNPASRRAHPRTGASTQDMRATNRTAQVMGAVVMLGTILLLLAITATG